MAEVDKDDDDTEVSVTVLVKERVEVVVPLVVSWAAARPEPAAKTARTMLGNCILDVACAVESEAELLGCLARGLGGL